MRRTRETAFVPANPFVAFADIAVAMAFIFAMCTLAFSKVLSDMTRDQQEDRNEEYFVQVMKKHNPGVAILPAKWARSSYDQKRNVEAKNGDEVEGRFYSNASYQRMEITRGYDFGSIAPKDPEAYIELGEMAKEANRKGGVDYIFLPPIVEVGEVRVAHEENRSIKTAHQLADARFKFVYDLWVRRGIVAAAGEWNSQSNLLNPRFVVDFGKEDLYSNSLDRFNRDQVSGRVDILLFFADKVNDNATHP